MSDVQHALGEIRPELRKDVAHWELLPVDRRVRPFLHNHGIRALPHTGFDPVAGFLRIDRSWNARAEIHLSSRVLESHLSVEISLGRGCVAAGRNTHKQDRNHATHYFSSPPKNCRCMTALRTVW